MFILGIIFIVFGAVFLLTSLGIISGNVFNIVMASVFIIIGLKILFKKKNNHHWCCGEEHEHTKE